MTKEELIQFGFRKGEVWKGSKHDEEYWFTPRDNRGKKFLICVRFWEFSKYSDHIRGQVEDMWDFEAHFNGCDGENFRVTKSIINESPAEVVEWLHTMWGLLGATYYELKDE